jgi:putative peptidoglycan lipid II flippase
MSDPSAASPGEDSRILANSAVMALGTTFSRLSGFVRAALLSYALGAAVHADIFTVATSLPTMLYILLAGGVFNAVLVPQLVRALNNDPDRGDAYTSRVVTAAAIFLAVVTIALVLAAPLIVDVVAPTYTGEVRDSAVAFTRYCLPQVFFYGMYVLVGQILNARGSFGPMMWAPIANNAVAVSVIVVYIGVFGRAEGAELFGGFEAQQEALLGIGSTVGIVTQFVILVPFLARSGFHFTPRFDLRGTGLSHTLRLGIWTVLFVIVNQIAFVVVQRLATSGASFTVYSFSFLVVMVPHSIITVSLATALLPRLSAHANNDDRPALATTLAGGMRSALVVILPFVALLPVIADDLARVVFGYGAAAESGLDAYGPTLSLFGIAIAFFTIHYLVLRGFYALEMTRTVFLIQCAVATTNIVAAVALIAVTDTADTAPALVLAYAASYAVGSAISYFLLARLLGGLGTRRLAGFLGRVGLATLVGAGVALGLAVLLGRGGSEDGALVSLGRLGLVVAVDVAAFLAIARLLRIAEVGEVLATVTRRSGRLR